MRVAHPVLILLLLTVGVAIAQTADVPGPDEFRDSECYVCHVEGGGSKGPQAPDAFFLLVPPPALSLPLNEFVVFNAGIVNAWEAELMDLKATLDLTTAPSLELEAPVPPMDTETSVSLAGAVSPDPRFLDQPFFIEEGATSWSLQVEPQSTGANAPDIRLELYGPGLTPGDGPATRSIDGAGAGGLETFNVIDAVTAETLGYGRWYVRIVAPGLVDEPLPSTQDQAFVVRTHQGFERETDRIAIVYLDEVVEGNTRTQVHGAELPIEVMRTQAPGSGEYVTLTMEATAHYDHSRQTTNFDDWRFVQSLTIPIKIQAASNGGGTSSNETDAGGDVILEADDEVDVSSLVQGAKPFEGWDGIGEVVGYFTGFSILLSFYTGGVFGRWQKRIANATLGGTKKRIAFHNFTSYLVTLSALAHLVIMVIEPRFPWTIGWLLGGAAELTLAGLAVTGMFQIPIIRKSNFKTWKNLHQVFAWGTILAAVAHMLLDGTHYESIQTAVNWSDPLRGVLDETIGPAVQELLPS